MQAYAPHLYTHHKPHKLCTLRCAYSTYAHIPDSCTYTPLTEACISAHLKLISLSLIIPFPWGQRSSVSEQLHASLTDEHANLCKSPNTVIQDKERGTGEGGLSF